MRTSGQVGLAVFACTISLSADVLEDPAFFRDPSGCTAVAALFTHDGRVFVVSMRSEVLVLVFSTDVPRRQMLATLVLLSV